MSAPDEFETIARLLRPLATAPEAFGLLDDAAAIPSRPGFDLVVTKDAIVEGVHFLPNDPLDLVARKLLRVNLSDLAAKGAVPYAYLLACAWPASVTWPQREAFARGLAEDQAAFNMTLLGGDTVATPGPLVLSATMFGWVSAGAMVRRSGARAGDLVQVSGPIGDGFLGLKAALGEDIDPALADHYRLPNPRLDLDLIGATACADISDGLLADAGHIARASGVAFELDLDLMPLSDAAAAWVAAQAGRDAALLALATGGDDYQLVATAPAVLPGFTVIGRAAEGEGVRAKAAGKTLAPAALGYRHGN